MFSVPASLSAQRKISFLDASAQRSMCAARAAPSLSVAARRAAASIGVDAALRIVDALQAEGYTFLTVRDLLDKAGVQTEAGIRYRSVRNAMD